MRRPELRTRLVTGPLVGEEVMVRQFAGVMVMHQIVSGSSMTGCGHDRVGVVRPGGGCAGVVGCAAVYEVLAAEEEVDPMSPTTQIILGSIISVVLAVLMVLAIVLAVRLSRLQRSIERREPLLQPRSHRADKQERRFLVAGDGHRSPQRVELRRMHQPTTVMPRVVPGEETVEITWGQR